VVAFNATGRIIDAGLGVGVADEMRCIMHGMDALVVEASSTHVPWQRRFDGARPPAGTAAALARLASIQFLYI